MTEKITDDRFSKISKTSIIFPMVSKILSSCKSPAKIPSIEKQWIDGNDQQKYLIVKNNRLMIGKQIFDDLGNIRLAPNDQRIY